MPTAGSGLIPFQKETKNANSFLSYILHGEKTYNKKWAILINCGLLEIQGQISRQGRNAKNAILKT